MDPVQDRLSTHTAIAPWWQATSEAYEERKARYTERLLSAAERALLGLRKAVRLCLPGTPAAFEFFTRRPGGMPAPSRFSFNDKAGEYGVQIAGLITSELLPGLFARSRIRAHGTLGLRDSAGSTGALKVTRSGEAHVAVTAPNGKAIVRHEQLARPGR